MGERKVLNKYYPADFDPSKICRRKQSKNQRTKVRTMLPISIRCNSCGNYMNAGTKLNARKEQVMEETYLGINCFRFYFRCTNCSAEIVKKTDSRNSDYVIEAGATPTRRIEEDDKEIGDDAMLKSLENRSLDSKQEMDVLANLEEVKSMKARRAATVSVDTMLEALKDKDKKKMMMNEGEDEALIKSIFSVPRRRRIHDDDIENNLRVKKVSKIEATSNDGKQQPTLLESVKFTVMRKPVTVEDKHTSCGIIN